MREWRVFGEGHEWIVVDDGTTEHFLQLAHFEDRLILHFSDADGYVELTWRFNRKRLAFECETKGKGHGDGCVEYDVVPSSIVVVESASPPTVRILMRWERDSSARTLEAATWKKQPSRKRAP